MKRRAVKIGVEFVRHIVPAFMRPARILWNEVIGFIFICLGVIFGFGTGRYAMAGEAGKMALAGCCTVVMLWYGVSSFIRARKISRS